jgi:hypothetical protein
MSIDDATPNDGCRGRGSTNRPNETKTIKTTSEPWPRRARRDCHGASHSRARWLDGAGLLGARGRRARLSCWELPRVACARNSSAYDRDPPWTHRPPTAIVQCPPGGRSGRRQSCDGHATRTSHTHGGVAIAWSQRRRGRLCPWLRRPRAAFACVHHHRLGVEHNGILARFEREALCAREHSAYG